MSQRPAARALAWRFFFSLGELRGREVGQAAITYSIVTLDPPKANAQSHRTRATSHSQNTRSISARNNKMHLPQKIFESPNATTLIRPTRFIECGGLFDSMKAS